MTDIFLSYARADQILAEPIKERLEALGLTVFFDIDGGIDAGDAFPQRIADAVVSSKATLACWTPHALTRPWCRRECFMARELHRLVPVALSPLTPSDLKEFIDASYESLVDFEGQEKHFGWSQTLSAIARRMESWVETNPTNEEAPAALDRASALRKASLAARPNAAPRSTVGLTGSAAIWDSLKDSNDPEDLLRFAETFVGAPESLEARRLAARLQAEAASFNKIDRRSVSSFDRFLADWPKHPRHEEVRAQRAALIEREDAERAQAEAEELHQRRSERGAQTRRAVVTFGPWLLGLAVLVLISLNAAARAGNSDFWLPFVLFVVVSVTVATVIGHALSNLGIVRERIRVTAFMTMLFLFSLVLAGTLASVQPTTTYAPTAADVGQSDDASPAALDQRAQTRPDAVDNGSASTTALTEDFKVNVGDRIFFDSDRSDLTTEARSTVERQAAWLREHSSAAVLIVGNTDRRENSFDLGRARAAATRDYLVSLGVESSRIEINSQGADRPLDTRPTDEAWTVNRNTQIQIVSGSGPE